MTWFKPNTNGEDETRCQRFWSRFVTKGKEGTWTKAFWLLSISSNAVVVIVSAVIAFICDPVIPEGNSRNTRSLKL